MRPTGRSVDDIHTNRVGIDLASTGLAALAPIMPVIMLTLCSMLLHTYYAHFNAGIIWLTTSQQVYIYWIYVSLIHDLPVTTEALIFK